MMKFLIVLLTLLAFVDAVKISFKIYDNYLYQTSIQVGKINKTLNVLLDFTDTQLWFFASNSTNSSASSPFLQLNSYKNLTISKTSTNLTYSSLNGLYDYDFNVKPYQAGNSSLTFAGNATINSSTFGIVYADNYKIPNKSVLGVGIMGVGSILKSNSTNYLSSLMNSTTQFVLCTRPYYNQALLIINEPYFNKSLLAKSVAVKYNLNPNKTGSFEFNITKIQMGVGYYLQSSIRAVITTLTNYLSVDQKTWNYIKGQFRPAYDANTGEYQINCSQMRQLRINFNVQSSNNNSALMIPGYDLIKKTKSGYCILKVRQSPNNIWALGAPFLRHHCVHVNITSQQLTFVNNTIFSPVVKKHNW